MKVYFQIAECSLSYAKIMQTSAMKVYFQIAECSLSYAKIKKILNSCQYAFRKNVTCDIFSE